MIFKKDFMNFIGNEVNRSKGFTIVELLVVIVVIGILASITIVSYTGITQKAIAATLQSDLSNAAKQIKMFQALSPTNDLPTANNCPTPGATEICIKTSGSNELIATNGYTVNNSASPKYFSLIANNGTTTYRTTESLSPVTYTSLATTDPANWIAIGTQVWAKANLNVGTRINGAVAQTNNAVLEKYCQADNEANCTTYGAIYLWDEAMQYVTTSGAQGICPAGSHIPTSGDYNNLLTYLGGGSVAGGQMKAGGGSSLNMPLNGYRLNGTGAFVGFLNNGIYWSSSELGGAAWAYYLLSGNSSVTSATPVKDTGFSIRCTGN